jgi:hypothetical protein
MRIALLTVALSSVLAGSASAQNVTMTFHDGLVSIEATSVPVRVILSEWGKKGGTKIIGTDRLTGSPLTLKLVNVPEAKALETLLRSAAGYMAAPRASADTGSSMYDRILVMPTSSTPATAVAARPAAPPPNTPFNGTQRFVPQRQQQQQAQEPDDQNDPDPNPPNPPAFTFPQPLQTGFPQPGTFTNGQPGTGQPYTITVNPQTGQPQSITIAPPPTTPSNMPTMPAGAATPGVIMAPQPAQQPGTTTRPPGRE